jgi:hypothetical protein
METAPLSEHRIESRNNIFVMATVYSGSSSIPVRVRNMSRSGALIEAAALPPTGTPVRLSRGSLNVTCAIMWVDRGRAGLHFATPVAVSDWLPQGKRGSGQQLIDEVVHQTLLGRAPIAASDSPLSRPNGTLAGELGELRQLLERAGEELAMDNMVTAHHLAALQMIDGVAQALARLAADTAA